MIPSGLQDFVGTWSLTRRIEDFRADEILTFEGVARIGPCDDGAVYHETGTLRRPDGAGFEATRRYLWRDEPGRINVCFEDGRPFHAFAPGAEVNASHWCDPDTYRVSYDFAQWPRWNTVWSVSGPRKDYRMATTYRPA